MTKIKQLMPVILQDNAKVICIKNYADTLVFDSDNNIVCIRFGGDPQNVIAMSDAVLSSCKVEIKLPDESKSHYLTGKGVKNYDRQITNYGTSAECVMTAHDELPEKPQTDNEDTKKKSGKKTLYFFCKDESELFSELDRKLSVPLIPEFADYFIEELYKRKILHRLRVYTKYYELSAWYIETDEEESDIAQILNDGLKNGDISIPNANPDRSVFDGITGFTDYLGRFGKEIAQRIKDLFQPLFNPETESVCDELLEANKHIYEHTGYSLYDAQLAGAESLKRQLEKDRLGVLVASCGTGKTKIGATALYAYQNSNGRRGKHKINVITCPSHVAQKWVRELYETVPDCIAQVVSSISDVDRCFEQYKTTDKTVFMVVSKESARNGYLKRPNAVWSKSKKAFICPDCGAVQHMTINDGGGSVVVKADSLFYRNENSKNHLCQNCNTVMWSALNPNCLNPKKNEWVHIGQYGFVHRKFAYKYVSASSSERIRNSILEVANNPDSIFPAIGAYRRYPISRYIKHKFKRIDALICDELHEYSGESAQGEAMGELCGIAKKTIAMTATLINGYSKGMFYLLFRLKPRLLLMDGFDYRKSRDFCKEYGVVEKIYEVENDKYGATTKNRIGKIREKFLPGISPIVYSKYLMENTVFLSLYDMGKELPDYEEIPIACTMDDTVKEAYDSLVRQFKIIMKRDKKQANRLLSAYLNLCLAYPDQPYGHEPIVVDEYDDTSLIVPPDLKDAPNSKELEVLSLIERKIKNGERVILYTAWVRLDTQERMESLLKERGYRVSILRQVVPAKERENWVKKKVKQGIDVLITNPTLVQTGLDLNEFTTLVFYNTAFNLYVLRQASCRSWRINQTAKKIEVYLFFFKDTMQQKALKLMASKLAAATMIEGQISEEGIAAMSDCKDETTELAKELMNDVKDNVEDLTAIFKKMAVHNERSEKTIKPPAIPQQVETPPALHIITSENTKEEYGQTGQLTLFDLLAS